jgi:hypothetical protein
MADLALPSTDPHPAEDWQAYDRTSEAADLESVLLAAHPPSCRG